MYNVLKVSLTGPSAVVPPFLRAKNAQVAREGERPFPSLDYVMRMSCGWVLRLSFSFVADYNSGERI